MNLQTAFLVVFLGTMVWGCCEPQIQGGSESRLLLLLRHSKATGKGDYTDFKKPLSKKGEGDALYIAEHIQSKGIAIDCIVSSSAVRAKTTAKIIAKKLDYPIADIILDSTLYKCKTRVLIKAIHELDDSCKHVLVVGHNPSIIQTANHFQRDTIFTSVPKSGLIGIEFEKRNWAIVGHQEGGFKFFERPPKKKKE